MEGVYPGLPQSFTGAALGEETAKSPLGALLYCGSRTPKIPRIAAMIIMEPIATGPIDVAFGCFALARPKGVFCELAKRAKIFLERMRAIPITSRRIMVVMSLLEVEMSEVHR
ncbi:hypothetical protein [Streptomyces sp. 021-3]|uniref:hypothetical protein n=1 Tax=Streptomyces sp. 021-3 TaxID=2789259 RepID=UPI0039803E39